MIKTLARSIKQEKENFRIPHSVQDVIPIRRIWPDGIFRTGNAYSRSYRLTDINYAIASKADKTSMLLDYSELLNALDSGACAKITINNRRVDRRQFEQELLIRPQADKLNGYRQEYNDMLRSHAASSNNVVQERYLTISAHKRSVDEARAYFQRMGGEVTARLGQLSSQAEELDASARLQILRDFFKAGQPAVVPFNMEQRAKRGHDFKDWFCPDSLEFYADFFKSDVRWGRVLYLQNYASFIKDDFIMELCGLDRSMMVSIDILPVPTDEAVRELQNKLLGVETNAVLFAAGPCWEGIDFPGDMVSLLVIARLPFPVPDPLSEAEQKQYPSLHDYIQTVVLPDMQRKLRQGFGRAIRTETDTCVVAILDQRAEEGQRYRNAVLEALPKCRITDNMEQVAQFIQEHKEPEYFV